MWIPTSRLHKQYMHLAERGSNPDPEMTPSQRRFHPQTSPCAVRHTDKEMWARCTQSWSPQPIFKGSLGSLISNSNESSVAKMKARTLLT
mmetsp:Transcript_11091/g.30631  ORF Transcript_11091/g.30631 Transcript_11091/m.30631 type:complete len:90 (-) Transcript_11091:467-736(-)